MEREKERKREREGERKGERRREREREHLLYVPEQLKEEERCGKVGLYVSLFLLFGNRYAFACNARQVDLGKTISVAMQKSRIDFMIFLKLFLSSGR